MIDTEADVSIIKISSIPNCIEVNTNDIIYMRGITDEKCTSIGSTNVILNIKHLEIKHQFHVVRDEFRIPTHGIIGKDFLRRHKCLIDYSNMTLTVRPKNAPSAEIHIQSEIMRGISAIPPRCQSFKLFRIKSNNYPCVVEAQQISDDIFIPTTIAQRKETWIRVLNTSEEFKFVNTDKINASPIDDYDIVRFNKHVQESTMRHDELKKALRNKIPNHAKNKLWPLCQEFDDIFHLPNDKATVNNFYTQTLTLKDNEQVYIKNYRLPQSQKNEIKAQVQKLLKNDLIELSTSNYNSPLILVPKKSTDGTRKWRMCIDYRLLNKKLIPDKFPLPRIDEILDGMGRAKFFSVMDLQSGYHQIPLEEKSRHVTAFSTDTGFYQWKVLPFGINVAPSSFTRMMTIAFSGLSPEQAFIYMDDIIVIGFSENQHINNLRKVFETCRKYNLKVNPEKCNFFRPEVYFLGHKCTTNGILPDPNKLRAIEKFPRPVNRDEAKRFVAFANYYRRFIKNFSGITKPITNLSRKNVEFNWTEECQNSFDTLRKCFLEAPLLAYPDFTKKFKVTVDASHIACGAVLSQEHGDIDRPILFLSRTFKKGEANKPIIEKELLAIHFALQTLRPYLYGTQFTVYSDHKPLIYLYKLKSPSSKLTRIRLDLEEFSFDVVHISGKSNVVADALSRIRIEDLKDGYECDIFAITRSMTKNKANGTQNIDGNDEITDNVRVYEELLTGFKKHYPRIKLTKSTSGGNKLIKATITAFQNHRRLFECSLSATPNERITLKLILSKLESMAKAHNIRKLQWPLQDEIFAHCELNEFKQACNDTLKDITIALIKRPEMIPDKNEREKILKNFHEHEFVGGHSGQKRMYASIRSKYYWPKMTRDVARYVRNCDTCNLCKPVRANKEPMHVTRTPQQPFDVTIIDTVGPLPKSNNGFSYVVTLICDLSKYLVAIPTVDKSAKSIAQAIFEHFVLIYGPMKSIRTDLGTEYINETMSELCKLMKIEQARSTAYHHESLGTVERNHRVLNEYLRAYLGSNFEEWDIYLRYFNFCYNITKSTTNDTKYSPYELVFGKQPNLPQQFNNNDIDPVYNVDNYARELKYRLQVAHRDTKDIIEKQKLRSKATYDRDAYPLQIKIGDQVKLVNEPYNKHKPIYSGPFTVTNIEDENVEIIIKNRTYKVHKNRLRKY